MNQQRDRNWNFNNEEHLLYAYMGSGYTNSEEDLAKIAADKARYEVPHVKAMLDIKPEDIVIDIGSGYGHIAKVIAPDVQHYHCCDISSDMLEKCRASTANFTNVNYHVIPRSDLAALAGVGATKVFSNSVFIHLNLFDITLYIEQVAKILPTGGIFYFNFQDSDILAQENDPNFFSMRRRYIADPQEITLMLWNSFACIRAYAKTCGLEMRRSAVWKYCATSVSFVKEQ